MTTVQRRWVAHREPTVDVDLLSMADQTGLGSYVNSRGRAMSIDQCAAMMDEKYSVFSGWLGVVRMVPCCSRVGVLQRRFVIYFLFFITCMSGPCWREGVRYVCLSLCVVCTHDSACYSQ